MARDRKRTRPRAAQPPSDESLAAVPGPLQHSGEVDEFDAALVRGSSLAAGAFGEPHDDDQPANGADAANEAAASAFGGDGGGGVDRPVAHGGRSSPAPTPRRSLPGRAIAFLQASWAELQRVQWPDRRQVFQATAVVLGFVAVAGLYLGAADWVAQQVVNFIL